MPQPLPTWPCIVLMTLMACDTVPAPFAGTVELEAGSSCSCINCKIGTHQEHTVRPGSGTASGRTVEEQDGEGAPEWQETQA